MKTLGELRNTLPQLGHIEWIGLRPERRAPVRMVDATDSVAGKGLVGDRYSSDGGKRQVTLIQAEHIDALASLLGKDRVAPSDLRRNLVVRGINLLALKGQRFRIGEVTLEYTGLCQPCSLMESTLGPGGYNAMRGHGGITAMVINGGRISVGDVVRLGGQERATADE